MKVSYLGLIVGALVISLAGAVHADMLVGGAVYSDSLTITSSTGSKSVLLSPMSTTNKTTGQSMITFCGDFAVTTSSAFSNTSGAGQAYSHSSLATASIYNATQKSMVNDLFSHVYASAFDVTTGAITDKALAQAMQLVIWEVLTETASSTAGYSLSTGTYYASGLSSTLSTLTNNLFSALTGATTWETLNPAYIARQYDMTVYVAAGGVNASQTQISVTAPTPEPATMLIFGLGLVAGVPMLRKRLRNK